MKTSLLLIYGYVLTYAASALITCAIILCHLIDLVSFQDYFRHNAYLILTVLTILMAICAPFQVRIIIEDNPEILNALISKNIRHTFTNCSKIQAITMAFCVLALCILATIQDKSKYVGFAELLLINLMIIEAIAVISNGSAYLRMREKIIQMNKKD